MRKLPVSAFGILLFSAGLARGDESKLTGSALIDPWVRAAREKAGVKSASRAGDAEFLRRVALDVRGVIPSLDEAERFLSDTSPGKRARLVDRLLEDPRTAEHWSMFWSGILTNFENTDSRQRHRLARGLRDLFSKNVPYDAFARRIVTTTGDVFSNDDYVPVYVFKTQIIAGEKLPLALGSTLTRAFMGIQIQCAECHDHPFEKWTQDDFYGIASFFSEVALRREKKPDGSPGPLYVEDSRRQPVRIPASAKVPEPDFLGTGKGGVEGVPRREAYARHLTSRQNLQFARTCVNRYWAQFFGRGIVHPPDDFSSAHRPSHPELLDALAGDFIGHNYDLRWLIRAITGSEAYQTTSRSGPEDREGAERWLAVARVRPLSPEQLLRSFIEAVGGAEFKKLFPGADDYGGNDSLVVKFRHRFTGDSGHEVSSYEGTIPTALLVMNSGILWRQEGVAQGLRRILERYPTVEAQVRALYLATLSREPDPSEREQWAEHVRTVGGDGGHRDALWTLLNTSEFLFNH